MVEIGCTLEGALTLGDVSVPGVSVVTLGDRCLCVDRVRRGRSVMKIGLFVFPDQLSMVSWRALMTWSNAFTVRGSSPF